MYKRIISFILALCLLVPANMFVFAAETETDYSRAFDLIRGLGIDVPDNEAAEMTRGEYAQLVSDVINYGNELEAKNGQFKDVTKNDSFSGAVYDLVERGVISGHEDGLFRPNDAIYMEQAVKILLSLMGYDAIAVPSGGYPDGYMKIADRYEMLEKVHKVSGVELTVGDAVQLVANAINTPVLVPSSFGSTDGYETNKDITLLTEYMKLQKQEGIITDNGISALTGTSNIGRSYIKINGNTYDATGSDACDYLGYLVEAYITIDDSKIERVVYVQPHKKVEVLYIDAKRLLLNDSAFTEKNIVYEDVYGRKKNAKVQAGADFIYNGTAHVDARVNDIKITEGEIILIDNDSNGVFEVVHLRPVQTIVVAGVHISSKTMYDKYGKAPIVLDDDVVVKVKRDGLPATIEDIEQWDVVSAYVSLDRSYVELAVSTNTLIGSVGGLDGESCTMQVDGEYYHITNTSVLADVQIGSEYEFCLDMQNNVAGIKTLEIVSQVAYFRKAFFEAGDDRMFVRLYTPEGEHIMYYLSNRVTLDGVKLEPLQTTVDNLNTIAADGLIEYAVDKNGEIRRLITPHDSVNNGSVPAAKKGHLQMFKQFTQANVGYCVNQMSFSGQIMLRSDTKVFCVPNGAQPEDYQIRDYNMFNSQTGYVVDAYSIGEDDGYADYLIWRDRASDSIDTSHKPILVTNIRTGIDADGLISEYIVGCGRTGEQEYWGTTATTFSDAGVRKGDVIRFTTDVQGRAKTVQKVYDSRTNTLVETASTNFFLKSRSVAGYVFSRYGKLVGITTANLFNGNITEEEKLVQARAALEYHNMKQKIYFVDKNEGYAVTEVTEDYVYDYLQYSSNCSKIYMYSDDGDPRMYVVYN